MKVNEFVPDTRIFNQMDFNKNKQISTEKEDNMGFFNTLKSKLDEVNQKQLQAEGTTKDFLQGDKDIPVHKVMLDSEEAKMSIELAVQVRNKLVEAYQELNRMQL